MELQEQPRASPSPSPTTTTPTLTSTPSPTRGPVDVRLAQALGAVEDGDYEEAIPLLEVALDDVEPSHRVGVAISLARAYIGANRHHDAASLLDKFVPDAASIEEKSQVLGLLAASWEAVGDWRAAISIYERYLELDTPAADYVRLRMARVYQAAGQDGLATGQLQLVDPDQLSPALRAEMLEELAEGHRRFEDYEGALQTYDQILGFATIPQYRALIQERKGDTLREAGRVDEAVQLLHLVAREHPETQAGHLALLVLDEMGAAELNDMERGKILYHARQYAACVDALNRYVGSVPEELAAQAHYYLGQAYTSLGQYGDAFQQYDLVIQRYPQDPVAADAWMDKARAAAAYGGDPSGLYHEFWRLYPDHFRAPEALWRAAVALERERTWDGAAGFYHLLRTQYPADSRAWEAHFREGLAAYAQGDGATALSVWSEALQGGVSSGERPRLLTWLGLAARATGNLETATEYWGEATSAAPWSYYGLRARDLEAGAALRMGSDVDSALPDGDLAESGWGEIEGWVNAWAGEVSADVTQNVLARRGEALWRLGWHEETLSIYRELRDQVKNDPLALVVLARIGDELELPFLTISCAEQLLTLGARAGAGDPPRSLFMLAHPTKYGHLVSAEAQREGVDPLLFLALIHQESRFDPQAVSYAGATGLTQVMPDTGQWIASRIGPDPYQHTLLFRPVVSVRFGVWFLAVLIDEYDRDWIAALAAYNAGPGNVGRWTGDRPIEDHDLFYETIPIAQTKDYVRIVYQQYRIYQEVYGSNE